MEILKKKKKRARIIQNVPQLWYCYCHNEVDVQNSDVTVPDIHIHGGF